MCLQSGMPLKSLVKKFKDMRFDPSGFTNNPQIPVAKSITDYVFRYLGLKFLPPEEKDEIFGPSQKEGSNLTPGDKSQVDDLLTELISSTIKQENSELEVVANASHMVGITAHNDDAPPCGNCGTLMVKAGSCYSCPNCFATTGVCN